MHKGLDGAGRAAGKRGSKEGYRMASKCRLVHQMPNPVSLSTRICIVDHVPASGWGWVGRVAGICMGIWGRKSCLLVAPGFLLGGWLERPGLRLCAG